MISVLTLGGKKLEIKCTDTTRISDVKREIESKYYIPTNDGSLIFGIRELPDNTFIKSLNLAADDFLILYQADSFTKSKLVNSFVSQYPRVENVPIGQLVEENLKEPVHQVKEVIETEPGIDDIIKPEKHDPADFINKVKYLIQAGVEMNKAATLLRNNGYDVSKSLIVAFGRGENAPRPVVETSYDVSRLSGYNFGTFNSLLDGFTNLEKHHLLQLLTSHRTDPPIIIQIFVACNKNFEATEAILNE